MRLGSSKTDFLKLLIHVLSIKSSFPVTVGSKTLGTLETHGNRY